MATVEAVAAGPPNGAATSLGLASESDVLDVSLFLGVLSLVKSGDFTARLPLGWTGLAGKVADALNDVIAANQELELELARVSRVVGQEGRTSQRVSLGGAFQEWSQCAESVNNLIDDLVRPTSEMQRVIGAVADGDLSKKVTVDVRGETLELKNTINVMVDRLTGFISEVNRVAREVGREGKLGQAAAVTVEVAGVWKELTENVNIMAGNLTGQVRNIAEVTTAVADGDLSKKISVDARGEFLELKNTVNAMVDQLNSFAGEVTRVAREVGVEGKLGGQAQSKEVAGVWKDLTDNVNQLAANLTSQVRAIADVATAVTEGDLTRQVSVEASGEVAELKNKLNEMIRNLRETTLQNTEQDWLKTNLERFARMLQGQRDLDSASKMILSELAPLVSAQHGVFYTMATVDDSPEPVLEFQAGYGYKERKNLSNRFRIGEGLVGQCALEKQRILLTNVPGDYVSINSGLGEATPLNLVVLPIEFEGSVRAVVELASFDHFSPIHLAFFDRLTQSLGLVLNTIEANSVTEDLLTQSRSQADALQSQQEELRSSHEDLGKQAALLADQIKQVEHKSQELERSRGLLEENAQRLAVSSRYKSEFIANMSHELRSPLNSLLILAEQLEDNPDRNLTPTQVKYATVIRSSGDELLQLVNDILDVAKIESGTVGVTMIDTPMDDVHDVLLRDFEGVARDRGLGFSVVFQPELPRSMVTDPQRLRQILANLLANAFKFTENGDVTVHAQIKSSGWNIENTGLNTAPSVLSIAVTDTGIGIAPAQQLHIFEAFAQAESSTARQYGGTGLGLSISRQLVGLLGGEISLTSIPGQGSTFTVYLPLGAAVTHDVPIAITDPGDDTSGRAPGQRPELPAAAILPATREIPPVAAEVVPASAEVVGPGTATEPPVSLYHLRAPGATILIVDDDVRNLFAMTALVERAHMEALSAESGSDAIAMLLDAPAVDLILMDIMMPIMDGYEAIRLVRQLPQFADLPIIAFTAKVDVGERERCIAAGASAYIPKPVNTRELLLAFQRWLPAQFAGTSAQVT